MVASGIKNLKLSSKVNEIDTQYKLDKKYPNPNNQPYIKKNHLLWELFFLLNKKIKNRENVIKLIIKKLNGGRLNELRTPKRKI